jgi:hypothetical protein
MTNLIENLCEKTNNLVTRTKGLEAQETGVTCSTFCSGSISSKGRWSC